MAQISTRYAKEEHVDPMAEWGISSREVLRNLQHLFRLKAPLTKWHLTVRPIAVIELEIARATLPGFRAEDV